MAEFVDVMKQYNRMVEAHIKGVLIPVEASYETAVKQPDFFEKCVMSWAKDHPEPIYPTWIDVMKMYGVTDETGYCYLDSAYKPIPADIAQKLGIEPKEAE